MTKKELIEKLKDLQKTKDVEHGHSEADNLLLGFINDNEISKEYEKIARWYS